MLDVFDRSGDQISTNTNRWMPFGHVSISAFFPISCPQLKDIMDALTLYFNTSADQFFLLDTGAPRSIWSEDWLIKASWELIQSVSPSKNTPSFRFNGHLVLALYAVELSASIIDT